MYVLEKKPITIANLSLKVPKKVLTFFGLFFIFIFMTRKFHTVWLNIFKLV